MLRQLTADVHDSQEIRAAANETPAQLQRAGDVNDTPPSDELLRWERDVAIGCEARRQGRVPPEPREVLVEQIALTCSVAKSAQWTAQTMMAIRNAKRPGAVSRQQVTQAAIGALYDAASLPPSAKTHYQP
jgi:hypothetical protein